MVSRDLPLSPLPLRIRIFVYLYLHIYILYYYAFLLGRLDIYNIGLYIFLVWRAAEMATRDHGRMSRSWLYVTVVCYELASDDVFSVFQ